MIGCSNRCIGFVHNRSTLQRIINHQMILPHMPKEKEPKSQRLTIEDMAKLAKDVLLVQGEHQPMLYVEGSKQSIPIQITHMPDTASQRAEYLFTLGWATAQQVDIGSLEQVFFVSEAWLNQVKSAKDRQVLPSQSSQRVEVLIINNASCKAVPPYPKLTSVLQKV